MPDQKRASMIVHQEQPFNAGPPPTELLDAFLTPTDAFFTRNHGTLPLIDPATYMLTLDGLLDRPAHLTLADLHALPMVCLEATLQCAGLRRNELFSVRPIPGELPWGSEPIGTALWEGIRLADLLEQAGVQAAAQHVAFLGLDDVERRGQHFGFGGSIPLHAVREHEVLLALRMNGEPLTPLHGAPLRVIVPGYIGARSVKWLSRITLQTTPSDNYFQQQAYKRFPAHISADSADWSQGEMLGMLPLNAVICTPTLHQTLPPGRCRIAGYAISGGTPLMRVEVSWDGGTHWHAAQLSQGASWTWRLWEIYAELPPGSQTLIVRAVDASGATQPPDLDQAWNVKGYNNNAWHQLMIHVSDHADRSGESMQQSH